MLKFSIPIGDDTEKAAESELYLYFDETGTPNLSDKGPFAVGVLISPKPLAIDIFSNAIELLENDEDFNHKLDSETIKRRRFHASFDSKNAHSYCCKAITSINWPIEFQWYCVNTSQIHLKRNAKFSASGFHRYIINMLVSTLTHRDSIRKLNIFIAERLNSFSNIPPEKWITSFTESIISSALDYPMIPRSMPYIDLVVCPGDSPNIQAIDFILWAVQRKALFNDQIWLSRLALNCSLSYHDKDTSVFYETYCNDREINHFSLVPLECIPDIQRVKNALSNKHNLHTCMLDIELEIRLLANRKEQLALNDIILERLTNLAAQNLSDCISYNEIAELCRLYVILVDSVPLYNYQDELQIFSAYIKKYLCITALDKRYPNSSAILSGWVKIRNGFFAI